LRPEFHDVNFDYHKKSFPSIKDHGVTDIIFGGNGLSAEAGITFSVVAGKLTKALVSTTNVQIDKITLNIDKKQTKHDFIDSMLAPVMAGVMTTKLQKSLQDFMESRLQQLCNQLNSWFESKPFESMQHKGNQVLPSTI